MDLGQAMLINASDSLGTPESIGWLVKIIYEPCGVKGCVIMTHSPHYPDGLFEVWVHDSTGEAGDVMIDLAGRIYNGPPTRDGIYCYWP